MHELTITPEGHLLVRENSLADPDQQPSKRLLEAYKESAASGMVFSATQGMSEALSPRFEFARSVARLYLTKLCHVAVNEAGGSVPDLPAPVAELERAVLQAPPMTGLEYLSAQVLEGWWRDLDSHVRREIASHPAGAKGYLQERSPQWRYVGRVTFHLAENKRNLDYPFAFLATYANGLTPEGKVKHEPLGRALQQYAGEKNREALVHLLTPISRAVESSDLVRKLVDDGDIYHPAAWSARQAYEFLKAIPLFESSGLIVRVPDWWNAQKPPRPLVSVEVNTRNSAGIAIDDLMQFSVGISLDGDTLSQEEIEELLESSGGLIPLKGKWVEVDREKLKEALTHWKRVELDVRREGISFFEGMRLLSGAPLAGEVELASEPSIREWTGLRAGAELQAVLKALRSPDTQEGKAPRDLKTVLRPYQQTGYSWLRFVARLGLGACLADDMGLGKTVQVIALLLDLKRERQGKGKNAPSLLVVPASLIANWKSELVRFAPSLSFGVVHPSEVNARGRGIGREDVGAFDLIITTYGMLTRTEWLKQQSWRLLILDEAQAIKNSGTKQTRAAKQVTASARIALTGTPVENRLSDLWSLFDFLNPGLLGSVKQFGSFIKKLESSETSSFEPLRSLVRPYILRRLKTDKQVIRDLPDKTEVKAYCPLSKHQVALYQTVVEELGGQLKAADGIQRRGVVLAQLMRLKQICNHPAQVSGTNDYRPDRSGKFLRLGEIVEEIAARQEKVLVFTQFREITEPLAAYLATLFGRPGLVLHGSTSIPKRKQHVEHFQREDGPPFFVLSLKAGGTGLNLTAASHVIHFDRWWNPAIENQATDRAFRIGQKKNVVVHKFICQGTLEEQIDEMITRKSLVAEEAIGGKESAEALLTELDDDTLMKFVKLDLRQMINA